MDQKNLTIQEQLAKPI